MGSECPFCGCSTLIACSNCGFVNERIADLQRENAKLREALQAIAQSEHQAYPTYASSPGDSRYGIGVADGHRCAANTARAALADGGGDDGER